MCLLLYSGSKRPGIKQPSYGDSTQTPTRTYIHSHIYTSVREQEGWFQHDLTHTQSKYGKSSPHTHVGEVLFESADTHNLIHTHASLHRKAYMYAACFFLHKNGRAAKSCDLLELSFFSTSSLLSLFVFLTPCCPSVHFISATMQLSFFAA